MLPSGDNKKVDYIAGANLASVAQVAVALGDQASEFECALNLLAQRNTEESEIIATLFAAWNDLLLDGQSVSDEAIIREFGEEWKALKATFKPGRLKFGLDWMRASGFVPKVAAAYEAAESADLRGATAEPAKEHFWRTKLPK
jgi:type I restriction enzyme S subunit